jgi:hypothetical protein
LLKIFLFPAIRAGLCFRPALAREYVSGTCLRFPEFTVWIYFYLAVLEAIHRENSRLAENSSFLCLQSPLGEIVVAVVEAELPPRMVDRNGQGPRAPRSVRTSSPFVSGQEGLSSILFQTLNFVAVRALSHATCSGQLHHRVGGRNVTGRPQLCLLQRICCQIYCSSFDLLSLHQTDTCVNVVWPHWNFACRFRLLLEMY